MKEFDIPKEILAVSETLHKNGYDAYLVGGCVRDLVLGRKPSDWDVTTNATPDIIQSLYEKTFYENAYGTVGVETEAMDETLKIVEVTPYRTESAYSDNRRPDSVEFSKNIEDDLKRRDFTINAIAYDPHKDKLIDLFGGQKDLKNKIIRTVGDPKSRFAEDGLRIIRAVRLGAQLGFSHEKATEKAIMENADLLENIAKERIRDEFVKIIMSKRPAEGLTKALETGILKHISPELERGVGIEQNQAHAYDVWTHLMKTVQHAADKNYPLHVRLAALLHDIGKPETRRRSEEKREWTFYGHEVVGARIAKQILDNLHFSRQTTDTVVKLVRWHMFFSDTEKITLSAVRRMVANVGKDLVWDLMDVRTCDRIGTGRPKENPYRLRKYRAMIEEAMRAPVSVGQLQINGKDLVALGLKPGPKFGNILNALLEEVLDEPEKNTKEYLLKRAVELSSLDESKLDKLGRAGKEKREQEEQKEIEAIRKRHHVQ